MPSGLFPVQLSLTNQASYNFSRKDLSALLICAPEVKLILEKLLPAANKIFNNLARLDIVGNACAPFKRFALLITAVDKVKTSALNGNYRVIINGMEDKWFKEGIYCDQLESLSTKKCRVLSKFMYEGNEKFQIYKQISKDKKISTFDGKIEFKEGSRYMVYLELVVKQVNNQMLHDIFKQMDGETVRFEPSEYQKKDEF